MCVQNCSIHPYPKLEDGKQATIKQQKEHVLFRMFFVCFPEALTKRYSTSRWLTLSTISVPPLLPRPKSQISLAIEPSPNNFAFFQADGG